MCNQPVKEEMTERERSVTEREGGAGEGTELNKEILSVLSKPSCTINKGESTCRAEMKESETYMDGWQEKTKEATDHRHAGIKIRSSSDEQHVAVEIEKKETAPYEHQAKTDGSQNRSKT